MIRKLLSQNPLFVFALESEAANKFNDSNSLFTGVGKVNAAYQLTKRILNERPSIIVNLGSAGSNRFARESIVCCTQFVQRDMDATMIGCKMYETPFSTDNEVKVKYGLDLEFLQKGVCGTGDSFEVDHQAKDYDVIDMEAYALVSIARSEGIPFLCLKYISDGADDKAAEEWEVMVHKAAEALSEVLQQIK